MKAMREVKVKAMREAKVKEMKGNGKVKQMREGLHIALGNKYTLQIY